MLARDYLEFASAGILHHDDQHFLFYDGKRVLEFDNVLVSQAAQRLCLLVHFVNSISFSCEIR